jgi:hypothetical protein
MLLFEEIIVRTHNDSTFGLNEEEKRNKSFERQLN